MSHSMFYTKCLKIPSLMSGSYLVLCRCGVRARWQRWRVGGGPEEILVLLIVNVPGIVGAARKLVETRRLFRFGIVELELCVFGVPAHGQLERSNRWKRREAKSWMVFAMVVNIHRTQWDGTAKKEKKQQQINKKSTKTNRQRPIKEDEECICSSFVKVVNVIKPEAGT